MVCHCCRTSPLALHFLRRRPRAYSRTSRTHPQGKRKQLLLSVIRTRREENLPLLVSIYSNLLFPTVRCEPSPQCLLPSIVMISRCAKKCGSIETTCGHRVTRATGRNLWTPAWALLPPQPPRAPGRDRCTADMLGRPYSREQTPIIILPKSSVHPEWGISYFAILLNFYRR